MTSTSSYCHTILGVFGSGDFCFETEKYLVPCGCFFPPHPPSFRYFKRQAPEKTFLLVPIVSYFKWKKYMMLNLNTKTLWMCKLQNSKPFSLCQCKPPKVQRIKYTLSSLTMIEHVPVLLKSVAGSLSNPPKAEWRFFKWAWEKEGDPRPNLSPGPLALSFENSHLAGSNHLTLKDPGQEKVKLPLLSEMLHIP